MIKKKLIVNADDFGLSNGVNDGIIQAFENGIVTSASLMVGYTNTIDAATYAKKNSTLGVGLHIDLGEWLFTNGNWETLYEVVSLDDLSAVKCEIEKQLKNFYQIMGKKPTHIDSHQHVHQREPIRTILIENARKLNIPLRGSSQKVNYCGEFYGQTENGLPFHDAISTENLKKIIKEIPIGITELACHPGLNSDLKTMYKSEREMELVALCDTSVRKSIIEENIELCSFDGILF